MMTDVHVARAARAVGGLRVHGQPRRRRAARSARAHRPLRPARRSRPARRARRAHDPLSRPLGADRAAARARARRCALARRARWHGSARSASSRSSASCTTAAARSAPASLDAGLRRAARRRSRATVAERYPWVRRYTPVNEPLTTARFSALYGLWYPHVRDDAAFLRAHAEPGARDAARHEGDPRGDARTRSSCRPRTSAARTRRRARATRPSSRTSGAG